MPPRGSRCVDPEAGGEHVLSYRHFGVSLDAEISLRMLGGIKKSPLYLTKIQGPGTLGIKDSNLN
jgi:hypothetical protein